MKKFIFLLIALLLFASTTYGVASNRVYYHIDIIDEFGETITSPAITQVDIQDESGTAVAVYSTKSGTTEVGSTGVITSGLSDGRIEFWYAGTAIDITVTDGTRTYEIESFSVRDSRFMLPSFLISTSGNALGQTDDLDFTYGSWVIDGDTANRLDMIPDNDGAVLAIGDGTTQADVYMYSASTSDYWLFDEGAGEVYYENLDLQFGDNDILYFGADNDASITFDETTDDNLEIVAASVGMSVTTNDFLVTLDGVAADQFKVDATGQINGDAINLETTDGGIMLNADGSSYGDIELNAADDIMLTSAGDNTIDATGGSIKLDCGEASAADGIVLVTTGAGSGIDITSLADIDITTTGAAGEDITLTNTGGSIIATATEDIADAIYLHASTGGIDILADGAAAKDIDITCTNGSVNILAGEDNAGAMVLEVDGSTASVLKIFNDTGTSTTEKAASVQVTSDVGSIELWSGLNAGDAVNIMVDSDTSAGITIFNDTGTGDESILLSSDVGGITVNAAAGSVDIEAVGGTDGDLTLSAGDILTMTHVDKIIYDGAAAETWEIEGTADDYETTVVFTDPTADATVTIPTGHTGTVMLAGASSEIYSVVVDVNAAEIKALAASPKELIAAPGSGKMLKLISCMMWLDKGTAYDDAAADGNMYICYVDGNGLKATGSIEGDAFIDAASDFIIAVEPAALAATAVTSVENDALVLDNDGDEYTTGTGTLKVFLTYAVITTGL